MAYVDSLTGMYAGLFAGLIVLAVILGIAVYVYFAFAWMTIAKKLGYKNAWLAWIPFANIAMILSLGGFHWAWIFLLVVPVLGWLAVLVLMIIATWRIFEKRKYPGWLALVHVLELVPLVSGLAGLAYLVIIGLVAWADRK